MSNWHYYSESGEKIGVTGKELRGLARTGRVTPDTFVEDPNGRTGLATNVKGLMFGETVQSETYDVKLPEPEPLSSIVAPPAEANPFTDPIPVEPNPFTATYSLVAPPLRSEQYYDTTPIIKDIPATDKKKSDELQGCLGISVFWAIIWFIIGMWTGKWDVFIFFICIVAIIAVIIAICSAIGNASNNNNDKQSNAVNNLGCIIIFALLFIYFFMYLPAKRDRELDREAQQIQRTIDQNNERIRRMIPFR
jgi:uncharacterized membrane protein